MVATSRRPVLGDHWWAANCIRPVVGGRPEVGGKCSRRLVSQAVGSRVAWRSFNTSNNANPRWYVCSVTPQRPQRFTLAARSVDVDLRYWSRWSQRLHTMSSHGPRACILVASRSAFGSARKRCQTVPLSRERRGGAGRRRVAPRTPGAQAGFAMDGMSGFAAAPPAQPSHGSLLLGRRASVLARSARMWVSMPAWVGRTTPLPRALCYQKAPPPPLTLARATTHCSAPRPCRHTSHIFMCDYVLFVHVIIGGGRRAHRPAALTARIGRTARAAHVGTSHMFMSEVLPACLISGKR